MSASQRRRFELADIGDVTVVTFTDREIPDDQTIDTIGWQLFALVDEPGRSKVLLNFGRVENLHSRLLGKLITLNSKLIAANGRLILCNIDPQIYDVFEITKMSKLLNIYKEEQAALQAF